MNDFNVAELKDYLQSHIPLVGAMELEFIKNDDTGVILKAPLSPNRNDKNTAFAGSVYSLLVLSGWSLVYSLLKRKGFSPDVVIASSTIDFLKPVSEDYTATARLQSDSSPLPALDEFYAKVEIGKKPALMVESWIGDENDPAARFVGRYHGWKK